MRLSFEVYTDKVAECKIFYTRYFNFGVKLELDGFVVLQHETNSSYELMFCLPHSPFVHPVFHPRFSGRGVILQMEVDDVEQEYVRLKKEGLAVLVPLCDEPVNGYHFAIRDPGGLLIDIVQFK